MHPDQASQAKLASLQPHLQRLSVLICSHLFWPKVPDANIKLELPGVCLCAMHPVIRAHVVADICSDIVVLGTHVPTNLAPCNL